METAHIDTAVEGIKQLNVAFEEFKKSNDANIAKRDVVLEEKTNRINDEMTRIETRLADLDKELKRANVMKTLPEQGREELNKCLKSFSTSGDKFSEHAINYFSDKKGYSVNVDSTGGYLVMPEFLGVISALEREISNLRSLASVQSTTTDSVDIVSYDKGTTSGWVAETDSRPETAGSKFQKINIPTHELYANPFASQKILDDAGFDFSSWLVGEVAERFAQVEGAAFINGDGVGKPRGILTYPSATTYTFGSVVQFNNTGGSLSANGIIDLQASLRTIYQQNATFLMNRVTMAAVRKFRYATSDGYIWQPSYQAGVPSTLLGSPVLETPDMPDTALNALPIAYGDFRRSYQVVDRLGLQILRDPYTSKPNVSFYATRRVGGAIKQFDALALLRVVS